VFGQRAWCPVVSISEKPDIDAGSIKIRGLWEFQAADATSGVSDLALRLQHRFPIGIRRMLRGGIHTAGKRRKCG